MLVRFVIDNFLSFGDTTEFVMFPYNKYTRFLNHIYDKGKIKLLKTTAIYGANASGKSNFIKAVNFFKSAVLGKEDVFIDIQSVKFKMQKENQDKPVVFEIEAFLNDNFYYYVLKLDNEGISEESLYKRKSEKAKDRLIFKRKTHNNKHKIVLSASYFSNEPKKKELVLKAYEDSILTNSMTFLRAFYKRGVKEIDTFYNWLSNRLIIEDSPSSALAFISAFVFKDHFRKFVNKIIKDIDTGIYSIGYKRYNLESYFGQDKRLFKRTLYELKNKRDVFIDVDTIASLREGKPYVYKIYTIHKDAEGQEVVFSLNEESDGTKRFISLLPMIGDILNVEITFFVDEIGRSLHPTLLKEVVKYLLSKTTKGQFIFTTHESHLLDLGIFRQDEIWFVEKDARGKSKMYSLAEFKPRADKDIRRAYLEGMYGAIPFLSGFEHLDFFENEGE